MHFMFLSLSEINKKKFVLSYLHLLSLFKRISTGYPQVSDSG